MRGEAIKRRHAGDCWVWSDANTGIPTLVVFCPGIDGKALL